MSLGPQRLEGSIEVRETILVRRVLRVVGSEAWLSDKRRNFEGSQRLFKCLAFGLREFRKRGMVVGSMTKGQKSLERVLCIRNSLEVKSPGRRFPGEASSGLPSLRALSVACSFGAKNAVRERDHWHRNDYRIAVEKRVAKQEMMVVGGREESGVGCSDGILIYLK